MTPNYNADARLRAIAMNAVREAMLVYQRWDRPFTDDDAARINDIFLLLHLENTAGTQEHAPLVEANQKPVSEAMFKIADLLGDEPYNQARNLDEVGTSTVALKLPKANRPTA